MNSIHEPGSRTMSKNRLRNNTESNRIENGPSAPSAQPVASPRAPAAPLPRLRAYPASACRARHARLRFRQCPRACQRPRACRPPATRAPHAPAPARPCRLRAPAPACACSAPGRVTTLSAVSQRPAARSQRLPMLYRDPGLPQAHNTVCIAIQTCCLLQYTDFSCNIIQCIAI